jgi:hypothetical protein
MIDLGKFIVNYYSTFIAIYNSTFNQLHNGKSIVLRPREKDPVLGLWLVTVTLIGFQVGPVKRNSQQLGRLCCNWRIEDATVRGDKVFLTFGAALRLLRAKPVCHASSICP